MNIDSEPTSRMKVTLMIAINIITQIYKWLHHHFVFNDLRVILTDVVFLFITVYVMTWGRFWIDIQGQCFLVKIITCSLVMSFYLIKSVKLKYFFSSVLDISPKLIDNGKNESTEIWEGLLDRRTNLVRITIRTKLYAFTTKLIWQTQDSLFYKLQPLQKPHSLLEMHVTK